MRHFIAILFVALMLALPATADTRWRTSLTSATSTTNALTAGSTAFFEIADTETNDSAYIEVKNCSSVTATWFGTATSAAVFFLMAGADKDLTFSKRIEVDGALNILDGALGGSFVWNVKWPYLWVDTSVAAGAGEDGIIALYCVKSYK